MMLCDGVRLSSPQIEMYTKEYASYFVEGLKEQSILMRLPEGGIV